MKKIGLIGGISWVSTGDYYKLINQGINDRLGGLNFSECLIYSFNYADIKKNNETNDWESTFKMLLKASQFLKQGGAEAIVLCANTMHFIADRLEAAIGLPVIHIATATAIEIQKQELKRVGLLGTKFTMELDFFKNKLSEKGIEVLIPKNDADRDFLHATIFEELGKGIVTDATKKRYLEIAGQLIKEGAEGIILGCTEIPLVIKPEDLAVPVFDTALLHSEAAVDFQLS
ncbi:aspartate/glutamate racemase family protein [Flavobacterium sp.]|uniref:aspartate/glutamate racemase family protein n=1 Tax=Flavobacterium sp. TaxID=239 RepID=UPI003D11C6F4